MKRSQPKTVQAIIYLEVPEFQIGQEVSVYFKDTMYMKGVCEKITKLHGKWRWNPKTNNSICSECNIENNFATDFCPHCGAKMGSEDNR